MFAWAVWRCHGLKSIGPFLRASAYLFQLFMRKDSASNPPGSPRCMLMSALVHVRVASADIRTLELLCIHLPKKAGGFPAL